MLQLENTDDQSTGTLEEDEEEEGKETKRNVSWCIVVI